MSLSQIQKKGVCSGMVELMNIPPENISPFDMQCRIAELLVRWQIPVPKGEQS
jgi:hypothetical protein